MAEPAARIMPANAFGEPDSSAPRQATRIKKKAASASGADDCMPNVDTEPDDIEKHALDTMA
jgi:hypothetical protein